MSLYGHENVLHGAAGLSDKELTEHAAEITVISEFASDKTKGVIGGQVRKAALLMERLRFEEYMRMGLNPADFAEFSHNTADAEPADNSAAQADVLVGASVA